MENSKGEFFQSKEYREEYLKKAAKKGERSEIEKIEIQNIHEEKVDTFKLFNEIDNMINSKMVFRDMVTSVARENEITAADAMTMISYVVTVKHQAGEEKRKWDGKDNQEK